LPRNYQPSGEHLQQRDLIDGNWHTGIEGTPFDGHLAFAVFTTTRPYPPGNIPYHVKEVLKPKGRFVQRWQSRTPEAVVAAATREAAVAGMTSETGGCSLDWRQSSKGSPQSAGLRMCFSFGKRFAISGCGDRLAGGLQFIP
jgi:hypothetical protein